ncbi:MAG: MCE family protein [Proteobacteria bacterium]|nr:MCE family protein [Pseudomonadota bacterium]MBU0966972.1 MCE family protein [Pseudomonadota bacterium]
MQTPEVKKRRGISPIWILPVVALLIGGWLLFKGVREAPIGIVVHFDNAEGVTAGKTRVMYRGIPLGIVRDITVDPGLQRVAMAIDMDSRAKDNLVEDVKFWIVRPEVSAGRISGLDTLLAGSYIEVQKGESTVARRDFSGLPHAPAIPQRAAGLHFKLKADELGSVQRGTKIFFKNISIGSVQGYALDPEAGVTIDCYIDPQYQHLVRKETRFWNSSGITLQGDLAGFKIHMESMASLIYGGISLYTPEEKKDSVPAENGAVYHLYRDFDEADYGIKITLQLPSGMGLSAGSSKVMYRGFEAGIVKSLTFNKDAKHSVTVQILMQPQAEFALRTKTKFWVVRPQLSVNRVENLDTLIKGSHISFAPGGGEFCDHFIVQEQPNSEEILEPGSRFTLIADNSRSFSLGAPVLFRKLQVGEITGFDLDPDGNHVQAQIFIQEKYAHLVKADSVFWKVGGMRIDAGLEGISVATETVTSILAGGVAFASRNLEQKPGAPAAEPNATFTVFDSYREATEAISSLKPRGLMVQLAAESLKSLSIGSPVLFKQIEVGEIAGFHLDEKKQDIVLDVFIAEKYAHLVRNTSRFYNVSGVSVEGGLAGIRVRTESLKSVIAGGIAFYTPAEGEAVTADQLFNLYDDYQSAESADKSTITLYFSKANGLRKGVEIRYQGIRVGTVNDVQYGADMDSVVAEAVIDLGAERFFRQDTQVWLVNPEFNLSGINNLDTMIPGPYIAVTPGHGEAASELTALDTPPVRERSSSGLDIVLETATLGSLKRNSPVYYRQVAVGRVTGADLGPNSRQVWVYINIHPPYEALIHEHTMFWNVSGIRVDAGLFSGVQIDTESMEAIVAGGISLATPEGEAMGREAEPGSHFPLHDKADAGWLGWQPAIELNNVK